MAFTPDIKNKYSKGDKLNNYTFENIDGQEVELKDFKGKLLFIDVWATW